jgi:hypothetical protein
MSKKKKKKQQKKDKYIIAKLLLVQVILDTLKELIELIKSILK